MIQSGSITNPSTHSINVIKTGGNSDIKSFVGSFSPVFGHLYSKFGKEFSYVDSKIFDSFKVDIAVFTPNEDVKIEDIKAFISETYDVKEIKSSDVYDIESMLSGYINIYFGIMDYIYVIKTDSDLFVLYNDKRIAYDLGGK